MIRITIVSALLVLSATAQTQQPANPDVPANLGITIIFQELNAKPELLHAAQLAPEDERATAQIVAEFVKTFRAYGRGLDRHVLTITDFILMRNDLVQKTRAQLRQRLTNAGWLSLDAYISRQMKHINLRPKETERDIGRNITKRRPNRGGGIMNVGRFMATRELPQLSTAARV